MKPMWPLQWAKAKLNSSGRRLVPALSAYLVLALVAVFTLDGFFRTALLFFFALLAIKTIHHSADVDSE